MELIPSNLSLSAFLHLRPRRRAPCVERVRIILPDLGAGISLLALAMTALQRRFHITSERTVKLGHDVEAAYDKLHNELSREQQKLLLRFIDAENRFHGEEKLDSFFSGFRLANGIHTE